jgi:hypothetical protein
MHVTVGDIVRYSLQRGTPQHPAMFPLGQPLVIEDVTDAGCLARFAYNITRFVIPVGDVAPFPSGMSASEAALEALVPVKGRLAEVHHAQMMEAYRMLVDAGAVPRIDERRVVREE